MDNGRAPRAATLPLANVRSMAGPDDGTLFNSHLNALEMAIWVRRHQELEGLVHQSDRGVQYLAIRTGSASPRLAPFARSAPVATATTTP
jgi:hypothetical protein